MLSLFTKLSECRFAGIDFESAGCAPGATDHPVQIGLALWSLEEGWQELWSSYIACDQPVTWSARRIHGIGPDDLKGAPSLGQLWPEIRRRLEGRILVGHNIGTEKRFLSRFPGHGFDRWIDTLSLSRQAYPSEKDHSLGAICETLGLQAELDTQMPGKQWHDGLYDAAASIALLRHFIELYQLTEHPVDPLLASRG